MIGPSYHLALLLLLCGLSASVPIRGVREADNCDHPFHSFLCNKAPKPAAQIQPDASASIPAKLAPKDDNPSPPLFGENSFLDPTFISTTKKSVPPSTIKTTVVPTTPAPKLQPVPDNSVLVPAFANPVPKKAKEEDLCSHPFHSFLCQPAKKNRKSFPNKSLVPENSFQSPVAIRPPSTTTTTRTTTPKPRPTTRRATTTTTAPPPQPEIPEASFDSPSFALPNNVQQRTASPPPAVKIEDLCAHSFHSWLCQPAKKKSINRKPIQVPESSILLPVALPPSTTTTTTTTTTTRRPTTTTKRPTTTTRRPTTPRRVTTTTTTTPPPAPEVPDASFDSPSFALPNKIQPAPQQVAPVVAKPPDLCGHAFHSFLCSTGSRRKNVVRKQPPPSEVPEQSVLLPVALPPSTTTTTTTTTRRPTTTTTTRRPTTTTTTTRRPTTLRTTTTTDSPPVEPAPSFDFVESVAPPKKQEPIPAATSLQSLPETYDKCKHAFHAFLCNTNTNSKRRRINERPASSNIDNSIILPVFRSTTTTTTTTTPKPRPPPPPPTTTRRPSPPPTQPPTTRKATTTTTRRPPPPPPPSTKKPVEEDPNQIPESSLDDPQRVILPVARSTTLSPHEDLCSHPFHSFLCGQNKNVPRTRRPIRIK